MKPLRSASQRQALVQAIQHAYMEIFPSPSVERGLCALPSGSRISITCSPAKGIDVTLDIAEHLVQQGFKTVPHISAKSVRSDAHLREIVKRLDEFRIDSLFVVGGDAPETAGPFSTALQLLRAISELDHKFVQIGVAAHPEGHPQVAHDRLLQQLEKKQQFANYLVTQMCFDPSVLAGWLRQLRDRGITLPAWIGLPGAADRTNLLATSCE